MKRNKRKKLAAAAQMNLEADRSLTFDTLTKPLGIGVVTDGVAPTTLTGAPSVQHLSPAAPQGVEIPHAHSGVYEFEGFSSGDESPSPVGASFRVSISRCFLSFSVLAFSLSHLLSGCSILLRLGSLSLPLFASPPPYYHSPLPSL